jgi:hypothetical protein
MILLFFDLMETDLAGRCYCHAQEVIEMLMENFRPEQVGLCIRNRDWVNEVRLQKFHEEYYTFNRKPVCSQMTPSLRIVPIR